MFTPWWRKRGHRKLQYVPHQEDWLYRSPYFFFRAVRMLLDRHPELMEGLCIRFAGSKPDWIQGMVEEFDLVAIVQFLGRIPLSESLRFQESCDALLLTSSKVIGGQDYSIAGKTFEYISMKKPIIAFVTEGAQKRLLARTGISLICDPDKPDDSVATLWNLLAGQWRATPDEVLLNSLHRRKLTGKLAGIIEMCVKGKR
jgi:glycosyltransferase involved in cell wall biosynthesis